MQYPDDVEKCEEGACCKACMTSDTTEEVQHPETNADQAMNVLFDTNNSKGVEFALDCTTAEIIEASIDFYFMAICEDDFDTIKMMIAFNLSKKRK